MTEMFFYENTQQNIKDTQKNLIESSFVNFTVDPLNLTDQQLVSRAGLMSQYDYDDIDDELIMKKQPISQKITNEHPELIMKGRQSLSKTITKTYSILDRLINKEKLKDLKKSDIESKSESKLFNIDGELIMKEQQPILQKITELDFNDEKTKILLSNINKASIVTEEIKLLSDQAYIPKRGTVYSACKDLFSPIDCVVPANKNLLIKTDVAIAWDDPTYYIQLLSRSGLAYKYNITCIGGVIDFDYRSNIGVLLQNSSDTDFIVKRGDRICQYAYIKITKENSNVVDEFTIPITSDRNGGFGSTGR